VAWVFLGISATFGAERAVGKITATPPAGTWDISRRRVAAAPQLRRGRFVETRRGLGRGHFAETRRGDAAAATWMVRGDGVGRRYRASALATHPDTSATDRGERFALVREAADALKTDAQIDALLATSRRARRDELAELWRDEVREWPVDRLAAYLRDAGLPEAVVAEFVEYEVDGREVVGLGQWGGDDVDHFIYALRWLGAEEEAGAAETERVLRELVQRECGDNFRHLKWPAR